MNILKAIRRFFRPEPFECDKPPEERGFKVCSMRRLPVSEKYLAIVQMPGGRFVSATGSGLYWTLLEPRTHDRRAATQDQALALCRYQERLRHA